MLSSLITLKKTIRAAADSKKALVMKGFFKTGKGHYGEGDIFLGLTVPISRRIARNYADLPAGDIKKLLASTIHEDRLIALLIMVDRFTNGIERVRKEMYDLYLASTKYINNWDLVDLSAAKIVGPYIENRPRQVLRTLARSKDLWQRRIAIVATYYFIKQDDFFDTFAIAKQLLSDRHDLIHKAVGWMLREVGKRSLSTLRQFLDDYKNKLPRTTLRYAIERFPEAERKKYLVRP